MTKTIFTLLITVLHVFSCDNKDSKVKIKKELQFEVGFNAQTSYIGVYYDKATRSEIIYFADPVSKKCIKIFNKEGNLLQIIPLKDALANLGEIEGVIIMSLDTIILTAPYSNKLIVINKQGKCWHKLNLNNLVKEKNGDIYEFRVSSFSDFVSGSSTLFLNCEWRSNTFDQLYNLEPKKTLENAIYFCNNSYLKKPNLLKISNFFDSLPVVKLGLNGFYKNISNTPNFFVEFNYYKVIDNTIYLASKYSNKLYKIKVNTMLIEDEIEIKSKFTKINTQAMKINNKTINSLQDSINYYLNTKGSIVNFFHNVLKKEWYVIVRHELKDKNVIKRKGYFIPFSVIRYNDDFTKNNEYDFSDSLNYNGYKTILTTEGLMVQIKSKDDKIKYKLLEFEN